MGTDVGGHCALQAVPAVGTRTPGPRTEWASCLNGEETGICVVSGCPLGLRTTHNHELKQRTYFLPSLKGEVDFPEDHLLN